MLVPAMQSIGTRYSSSTFSTPTCAAPRAPPPDRTRQILGRCTDRTAESAAAEAAGIAASTVDTMQITMPMKGPALGGSRIVFGPITASLSFGDVALREPAG